MIFNLVLGIYILLVILKFLRKGTGSNSEYSFTGHSSHHCFDIVVFYRSRRFGYGDCRC